MKIKHKKRKILCPSCKTGRDSYIIDPASPACPYVSCYNGFRCAYYVPVNDAEEKDFFQKIINKTKNILKTK